MEKREALINECLAEVARRYDRTFRFYHGYKHSSMVLGYVTILTKMAGCTEIETEILQFSAAGHDWEQEKGRIKNEKESGRLLGDVMRRYGYSEDEISFVQCLVMGTVVYWTKGVMHQEAESMGQLAKLLADADLCALGAPEADFVDMAQRTMAEIAKKPIEKFTGQELLNGWQSQVKFMTGRRYLTPEANELFGEQMKANLAYAKRMAGE